MKRGYRILVAAGVASLASSAWASIPEGDIHLTLEGGQLRVGLISEDGSTVTPGMRVFFAEFGADAPNVTDEPGVQSPASGQAGELLGATSFSFTFLRALRVWNGTDFATLAGSTLTADLGPLSATSPGSDVPTAGFSIALDASGSHEHPDWTLGSPASDGVYLIELGWSLNTGQTSQPTWLLFSQNTDEATNEAAYAWATANIPAPAGLAVLSAAGLVLRRRR